MQKCKKYTPPPRGTTAILYPERGSLEDTALAYLSGGGIGDHSVWRVSPGYLSGNSLITPSGTRKIHGVAPAKSRQKNGVARPLYHQRV